MDNTSGPTKKKQSVIERFPLLGEFVTRIHIYTILSPRYFKK